MKMKQFRLTVERVDPDAEEGKVSKWVVTLLDNGETDTDPHTITSQMGDTVLEALDKTMMYVEREVLASEHKEDSL